MTTDGVPVLERMFVEPLDYDTWAQMGCRGWSYQDVLPVFKSLENNEVLGDAYHGRPTANGETFDMNASLVSPAATAPPSIWSAVRVKLPAPSIS